MRSTNLFERVCYLNLLIIRLSYQNKAFQKYINSSLNLPAILPEAELGILLNFSKIMTHLICKYFQIWESWVFPLSWRMYTAKF